MENKIDGMSFSEFSDFRKSLISNNDASILDLAEHDLVNFLKDERQKIDSIGFSASKYRCHLAEKFVDFLSIDRITTDVVSVGIGVRDSLERIVKSLGHKRWLVPSDVYPKYIKICDEWEANYTTYEAMNGGPSVYLLNCSDVLLICDPLKPWGGSMESEDEKNVLRWLSESEKRLVVIDAVYGPNLSDFTRRMYNTGRCIVLTSMSKGWLEPLVAGFVISPKKISGEIRRLHANVEKVESSIKKAYYLLSKHQEMPQDLNFKYKELERSLKERYGYINGVSDLNFCGYFAKSDKSADTWLKSGVLTMPGSVFGASIKCSIVSLLCK